MNWTFDLVYGPLGRPIVGLAWDGEAMLFSDSGESVILRYDRRNNTVTPERKYTNRTNGIAFGQDGVLYGCQEGSRRIVRFMPDGSATTTATRIGNRVHNMPYLLTLDRQGQVWFSDPDRSASTSVVQRFPPLDHQSVLRLACSAPPRMHWHIERMTFDTRAPRGVALSPDEKTLYVVESDNKPGGVRELRAYPINDDGTLGSPIVLHTFGCDYRGIHRGAEGLCVDVEGNIVACAGWRRSGPGPLIYVFSPAGSVLESHAVPAGTPLNCAFGDPGLASLYVSTSEGHLFRVRTGK